MSTKDLLTNKEIKDIVRKSKHVLGDKKINVRFVPGDKMKALNNRYLGENGITDVLSFDYGDEGDIALNKACILERKKESETPKGAAKKILVHGILHLYGYEHKTEKENAIMEKKHKKILERL